MRLCKFLNWKFDRVERNCWHFTRAVWKELTGYDLGSRAPVASSDPLEVVEDYSKGLKRITRPASPCLVVAIKPRTVPHVGVYYQGMVMHANQAGVRYEFLELFKQGYPEIQFYVPNKD